MKFYSDINIIQITYISQVNYPMHDTHVLIYNDNVYYNDVDEEPRNIKFLLVISTIFILIMNPYYLFIIMCSTLLFIIMAMRPIDGNSMILRLSV